MIDIQGRKYGAVTVCDVTFYDVVTKYPVMFFDTLKVTTLEGTADITDIQGGQGNTTLASISHSKAVNITIDDALMTMSSLALLTGGDLVQGDANNLITMKETDLVTVVENEAGELEIELERAPKIGSYVYIAKSINEVLSTATRSENKITGVSTNKLSLSDASFWHNLGTIEEGDVVRVFYDWEMGLDPTGAAEISELSVLAEKFAGTYRMIGDTVLFNQFTGLNDSFQIDIPKFKLDSTFNINFSAATEAVVFSFKGKALRDGKGNMVLFRQLTQNSKSGEETYAQLDGSYKSIPAKEVMINEITGEITDI